MLSRLPFFKVVAIVQVALLVRRHLKALSSIERRRMAELARRPHKLNASERRELRSLAMKLEPGAFAGAAANHLSPLPLPKKLRRAIGLGSTASSLRSR
jgi:hypothetical protein